MKDGHPSRPVWRWPAGILNQLLLVAQVALALAAGRAFVACALGRPASLARPAGREIATWAGFLLLAAALLYVRVLRQRFPLLVAAHALNGAAWLLRYGGAFLPSPWQAAAVAACSLLWCCGSAAFAAGLLRGQRWDEFMSTLPAALLGAPVSGLQGSSAAGGVPLPRDATQNGGQ